MSKPTVVRYEWKAGGRAFKTPAVEAHNTIELIRKRDGACTPAALVEWARNPDAPLHQDFEWNDSEAAEAYRRDQARTIMNHLVVVYRDANAPAREKPGRAFIALKTLGQPVVENGDGEDIGTAGYIDSHTVMTNPDLRRRYIVSALREIGSWRRKHADIVELARLFEVIDPMLAEYQVEAAPQMIQVTV